MVNSEFLPYKVGFVHNPSKERLSFAYPVFSRVKIKFPTRLNAMALDPKRIASKNNMVFTPGEVVFSIKKYILVEVSIQKKSEFLINAADRATIVKHAYLLMKVALNFSKNLKIEVDCGPELRHIGFGTSSAILASVASAINELFGNPLSKTTLLKYLAQNHGEEIEGDSEQLMPVQCIGGSAASGLYEGALLILAGEATVIKTMNIDLKYKVVVGIPNEYRPVDAKYALEQELEHIKGFIECGEKYGEIVAYQLVHKLLPAMSNGNLDEIGDVIFDYRFNMGSIKNCSFLYPQINNIAAIIAPLKLNKTVAVLSLSSVGPLFFAVTDKPKECCLAFNKAGMKTELFELENSSYQVLERVPCAKEFWDKESSDFRDKAPSSFLISHLPKAELGREFALDVGCGGGRHTLVLLATGYSVYAIDTSEEMIQKTKEVIKNNPNRSRCVVVNQQMDNLNLERKFDIVISTGVLHQAKTAEEYSRSMFELARVLKDKGLLIIEVFTNNYIDPSLQKIDNSLFLTKEGLYMTLHSVQEIIDQLSQQKLQLKDSMEEIKKYSTGKRSVFRGFFQKK